MILFIIIPLAPPSAQKHSFSGEKLNFEELKNPHCAADLLKIWFRSLPEPVVTARLYPRFMSVGTLTSEDKQV